MWRDPLGLRELTQLRQGSERPISPLIPIQVCLSHPLEGPVLNGQAALGRVRTLKSAKLPVLYTHILCSLHFLPLGTWRYLLCQKKQSWESPPPTPTPLTPCSFWLSARNPSKVKRPHLVREPMEALSPQNTFQTLPFLFSIIICFHIPSYPVGCMLGLPRIYQDSQGSEVFQPLLQSRDMAPNSKGKRCVGRSPGETRRQLLGGPLNGVTRGYTEFSSNDMQKHMPSLGVQRFHWGSVLLVCRAHVTDLRYRGSSP